MHSDAHDTDRPRDITFLSLIDFCKKSIICLLRHVTHDNLPRQDIILASQHCSMLRISNKTFRLIDLSSARDVERIRAGTHIGLPMFDGCHVSESYQYLDCLDRSGLSIRSMRSVT